MVLTPLRWLCQNKKRKRFPMISGLEIILSFVSSERKNINYQKIVKLKKNNNFNNVFGIFLFFFTITAYRFLKKWLDFNKSWLIFFAENILYSSTVSNFKSKAGSGWSRYNDFPKRNFFFLNNYTWIFYSLFSKLETVEL